MTEEKRGRGRPPHEPTKASRNLASLCSAIGKTQEETAAQIGISVDTLFAYYQAELVSGKSNVDIAVAGKLVSAATSKEHTGPTITAAIFYAKTQMKWRESVEVVGRDGGPIETSDMSARELIAGRITSLSERLREEDGPRQLN